MKYRENLNPISKWDDVGNNMLDEMREEAQISDREWKEEKYQLIVEEGYGSEEVLDEWMGSELNVVDFIRCLKKNDGRISIWVKNES